MSRRGNVKIYILIYASIYKNLVGKFISNIILQVLSFVAENERNNIRAASILGVSRGTFFRLVKERKQF